VWAQSTKLRSFNNFSGVEDAETRAALGHFQTWASSEIPNVPISRADGKLDQATFLTLRGVALTILAKRGGSTPGGSVPTLPGSTQPTAKKDGGLGPLLAAAALLLV
jgi:hypothetical protein